MKLCLNIHLLINIDFTILSLYSNEDDDMLDPNVTVNINDNDDDDVDNEIIPLVPEFIDVFRSNFVVSHNWTLSHRCISRGFDLEVEQTFNSKKELVNVVKQ